GRRIIQRYNLLSTTFFHRFRSKPKPFQRYLDSRNLLINKAFIVPTALEVVRIIRGSETSSTLYF
ncbi:hypothetical protein ACLUUI_19645, partial [Enterobacterales bacterium AW_CKDN230030176-1A_HGKHYDSX7]